MPGMHTEQALGRERQALGICTSEVRPKFRTQQILSKEGNPAGQKAQSCGSTAFSVNFVLKYHMLTEQVMNSKCPP